MGAEFFLTVVTLLGGAVEPSRLHEWVLWHIVAGADHFVIFLFKVRVRVRATLTLIQIQPITHL